MGVVCSVGVTEAKTKVTLDMIPENEPKVDNVSSINEVVK